MPRARLVAALCLALCLALGACQTTQTTSGQAYLDRYSAPTGADAQGLNAQLRAVAAVEPTLTFPARVGLARIDRGQLTAIPDAEMGAWLGLRDRLGPQFGEFVPVSPLIAQMVSESQGGGHEAIASIRLAAARQHLDAVLIYEVYAKMGHESNLLTIGDLTLIGAFILPSQAVEAQGFASALLIDPLQGYPYGTAQAVVDKRAAVTTSVGAGRSHAQLIDQSKARAVEALVPEVETMVYKLRAELAQR